MTRGVSVRSEVLAFVKVQVGKIIVYLKSLQTNARNWKLRLLTLNAISITIHLFLQKPVTLRS